jgi:hypothetical protein
MDLSNNKVNDHLDGCYELPGLWLWTMLVAPLRLPVVAVQTATSAPWHATSWTNADAVEFVCEAKSENYQQ